MMLLGPGLHKNTRQLTTPLVQKSPAENSNLSHFGVGNTEYIPDTNSSPQQLQYESQAQYAARPNVSDQQDLSASFSTHYGSNVPNTGYDPFQNIPDPTKQVPPLTSNFASTDSSAEDLFTQNEASQLFTSSRDNSSNIFGGPPPVARRGSSQQLFGQPQDFSSTPNANNFPQPPSNSNVPAIEDPFRRMSFNAVQTVSSYSIAPPPPAAPFLGYGNPNTSSYGYNSHSTAPPHMQQAQSFSQNPSSGGPPLRPSPIPSPRTIPRSPPQIQPQPSPGRFQPPSKVIVAQPIPVAELLHEFLSKVEATPDDDIQLEALPNSLETLEDLFKMQKWKHVVQKATSMLKLDSNNPDIVLHIKVCLQIYDFMWCIISLMSIIYVGLVTICICQAIK